MREMTVRAESVNDSHAMLAVFIDGNHSGQLTVKLDELVQFVEVLAAGCARKLVKFSFDTEKVTGTLEKVINYQVVVVRRSDLPGPVIHQLCTKQGKKLLHGLGPTWMMLPPDAKIVEVLGDYDHFPTEDEWEEIETMYEERYPQQERTEG